MPGHDEDSARRSRQVGPDEPAGDGGMGLGGTGRLGDAGAGGATTDPDAFGRMAGGQVAPDDPATEIGDPGGFGDPGDLGDTGDRTDEDLLENR